MTEPFDIWNSTPEPNFYIENDHAFVGVAAAAAAEDTPLGNVHWKPMTPSSISFQTSKACKKKDKRNYQVLIIPICYSILSQVA